MSKIDRIRWELSTAMAIARLRHAGVKIGSGARFLGQPIVTRYSNSVISVGERLVATSRSQGTALGVRSPVILRTLADSASLIIGDDAGMSGTVICAARSIRIGARCMFGADCMVFDTDFHNRDPGGDGDTPRRYSRPDWAAISASVVIGDDVFIGARAIVTKGVTIGSGSIIAAGSIVTRDLPPNVVAAGIPARVVGDVRSVDTGGRAG